MNHPYFGTTPPGFFVHIFAARGAEAPRWRCPHVLTWTMCVWHLGPEKKKKTKTKTSRLKLLQCWLFYDFSTCPFFFWVTISRIQWILQMDPRMIPGWVADFCEPINIAAETRCQSILRRTDVFTDSSLVGSKFFRILKNLVGKRKPTTNCPLPVGGFHMGFPTAPRALTFRVRGRTKKRGATTLDCCSSREHGMTRGWTLLGTNTLRITLVQNTWQQYIYIYIIVEIIITTRIVMIIVMVIIMITTTTTTTTITITIIIIIVIIIIISSSFLPCWCGDYSLSSAVGFRLRGPILWIQAETMLGSARHVFFFRLAEVSLVSLWVGWVCYPLVN